MSTKSKLEKNNATLDRTNLKLMAIKNAFMKPLPQYEGSYASGSGIDTSDATATQSDIVQGKTAYVNGTKLVGTHKCSTTSLSLQEKTVTPSTAVQYVTPDSGYDGLSKVTVNKITFNTQDKQVIPTKETQYVEPDSGYEGLDRVTVHPIPDEYVKVSGGLSIQSNGTFDVTNYASVNVNVASSGSSLSETVTLNTDTGDVVVTAPPKEARSQAWFILTVPGQSKFFLYVTPFGWGRYNSKYYVIKQNGTELEGSADYPYLVYEMSTSTPLGTWTYSGSGYASTQAYLYWAEASNTDIYEWSNLSTKGSTIHFAKNTD